MSEQYQQAKEEAREAGVDPDGFFERTVHINHDEVDELGYLTVDVWADEDELEDIQTGLYDDLAKYRGSERTIARNIPAMLRRGLIWNCSATRDRLGIDSPEDLEEQLDEGVVSMFQY